MDEEADCVLIDTRLAGQVRRYHTWPIIGNQTIAEHCWQILRIYLAIVDSPDPHMVHHIMFHDIGEIAVGDAPYPVKKQNSILKENLDFLEHRSYCTQLDYWGGFHSTFLTDHDKVFFKQIELIEMAEFGIDQMLLGNQHGYIVATRCLRSVFLMHCDPRLARYVVKRLNVFYEQNEMYHDLDEDWWFTDSWEKFYGSESEASGRTPLQN